MTDKIRARVLDTASADPAVRPQDDFYRAINGKWIREHVIPADRPIDGAFHALRDLSEERGRDIACDAAAGTLDDVDAPLIARLWTDFMDEDSVETQGVAPLLPFFDLIDSAADTDELDSLSGRLMAEGVGSFFGVYVGTHPHDSNTRMLTFVQSGISLPDESYYRDDAYADIRDAYVAHLERLLALTPLTSNPSESARRLMALETRFAAYHRDAVSNRDPLLSDNQMTWDELTHLAPHFNWDAWATSLGLSISPTALVNVCQPDFLANAAALWADTPREERALFLKTSLLEARSALLSSTFVDEHFDFYGRTLSGTQELRPRWKRALGLIESLAGESLGRVWVARHFPPESKERMDALVAELLAAFGRAIRECEWMGEATQAKALDKLATFRPKIGYPPQWKDMSGLDLSRAHTLVDIVATARAFETRREFSKLNDPVDRDEWFMTPQTVNAYYNPTLNEIVFPAAILQPPFFDPQADDAVNFGAIGAVIGHEIGHGFDDQGSRFDAHGNLENWWAEEDRARFVALTDTLIAQYDGLTPHELEGDDAPSVNGALTVGENIGDLAGLTIAWNAWVHVLKQNGLTIHTAPVIDGLTGPERFFTAWARTWRTASRPEFARHMLAVDPHSPAEFRCNQVLRNIDAFHLTYSTSEGDDMYVPPSQRVRIW